MVAGNEEATIANILLHYIDAVAGD